MKLRAILGSAVALLTAVVPVVSAQDLSAMPQCAIACLTDGITHSTCAANLTAACVCSNAPLQAQVSLCVAANCTMKEALVAKNATSTSCGVPLRDRGTNYDTASIVLIVVSSAIVALRLGFKLLVTRSLSSDDWVIFGLLFVSIPSVGIIHYGTVPNGVGRDIWTLTPEQITNFLFYFYIMAILYFTQVALIKICLLLFYLRIFPARPVRRLLWATVGFSVAFGIFFIFLAIFQCTPISFFWDKWDREHEGKCLDSNAIAWANAALSIALDFWMLAIPLAQLKTLNLHWKKKIGVALMFCVGTFVTIVSIVRLRALVVFGKSSNPTWDNFPVSLWSTVEISVGIICTCMPTLRLLLVRLFPVLGGSSYGPSNGYYQSGSHPAMPSARVRGSRSRTLVSSSGRSKLDGAQTSTDSVDVDAPPPAKLSGIVRQQTYAVQYDDDETSLVQMRGLDSNGKRPGA
ncbi:hypothetical protein N657DRAFT_689720 [Parathielavia appendiculata]|uniref:CFEM domain-containing protein n=1 Tax=Parathielavia appendiculata TaxID=2587402 RepID=A0AAN6U0F3_9PEZI|nr:hypothetical protein N657DRAFT_689720 [Parathielavia appendiculata]